jgi:hypothetical protein
MGEAGEGRARKCDDEAFGHGARHVLMDAATASLISCLPN